MWHSYRSHHGTRVPNLDILVPSGPSIVFSELAQGKSGEMVVRGVKERADRYQQRHSWAGFPYAVLRKFGDDRAGRQAALISYFGFISLFPLLLAFTTTLEIVLDNTPALRDRLLRSAVSQFPIIGDQIRQSITSLSGSTITVAIGFIGALWAGLAGINAMQDALDHVWGLPARRPPRRVKRLLRRLVMLIVLATFTIIATGLAGAGAEGESMSIWFRLSTFSLSILLNITVYLLAFKLLTEAEVSWRDVLPGAMVAGLAWTGLQTVGSFLVSNQFKRASAMYGFFGVVIGLLSWMYLTAQLSLFCAEINVVRKRKLWPRSLGSGSETEADSRALPATIEEQKTRQTAGSRC